MNYLSTFDGPFGELLLVSDGESLLGLYMDKTDNDGSAMQAAIKKFGKMQRRDVLPIFEEAIKQLSDYFSGKRNTFDIPIKMVGSDFQKQVWQELLKIPYGCTTSYGEIAARISNPSASRAVGLANGNNPIGIIVPCHRVIGANGSLTGYAGGMDRKRFLLDHERRHKLERLAVPSAHSAGSP